MKNISTSSKNTQNTMQQEVALSRFNPQFIGIGHVLQKQKSKRKMIQKHQMSLTSKVQFLAKQNQRSLLNQRKKQQQFANMIEVANRRKKDQQQKLYNKLKRQRQLNRQKNINRNHKIQHETNKRNNFSSLYGYNLSQARRIKQQSHTSMSRLKNIQIQSYNQNKNKVMSISSSQEKSRQRINEFFKKKNDKYTNSYLKKIGQQRKLADNKTLSIRYLQTQEQTLRQRLNLSKSRINEMNQTINEFFRQSRIKFYQKIDKNKKYQNFVVRSRTISIQNPELKQKNRKKQDSFQSTTQKQDSSLIQNERQVQNLYDF